MDKDVAADGVRGWAALSVVASHFLLAFYPMGFVHFYPWVALPGAVTGRTERLIATPGVSVLWNGRFAVSLFFVLSGYVLTRSFCATGALADLQAGALRRYLRLALPILASVLFSYVLVSTFGKPYLSTAALTRSAWLADSYPPPTPVLADAVRQALFYALFYRDENGYNGVLWTMPLEFVGSLLIFAYRALAGRSLRNNVMASILYLAVITVYAPVDWPFLLAFLLGTHLNTLPRLTSRPLALLCVLFGLFLGSYDRSAWYLPLGMAYFPPVMVETTASVCGGALVIYAVRSGAFDRFLQAPASRFLGRISFALYLLHIPLIVTWSCGVFNALMPMYPQHRLAVVAASLALTLPLLIALASSFERLIDRPTLKLVRRLFPGLTPPRPVAIAPASEP